MRCIPKPTPRAIWCRNAARIICSSSKTISQACGNNAPGSSQSRLFPPTRSQCEKGHGRTETRAVHARTVLTGELPFPDVAQVARVDRRRECSNGTIEQETVFAITSRSANALGELALATALRAHWGIENAVHYRRDRTYDEDRTQFQKSRPLRSWPPFAISPSLPATTSLPAALACVAAPSLKCTATSPRNPQIAVSLLTKPWR